MPLLKPWKSTEALVRLAFLGLLLDIRTSCKVFISQIVKFRVWLKPQMNFSSIRISVSFFGKHKRVTENSNLHSSSSISDKRSCWAEDVLKLSSGPESQFKSCTVKLGLKASIWRVKMRHYSVLKPPGSSQKPGLSERDSQRYEQLWAVLRTRFWTGPASLS